LEESGKLTTWEEVNYFKYNLSDEAILNDGGCTCPESREITTVKELEEVYNEALTFKNYRNRQELGEIKEIGFFSGTKKDKYGDNLELCYINFVGEIVKLCTLSKKLGYYEEYFTDLVSFGLDEYDEEENNRLIEEKEELEFLYSQLKNISDELPQKAEILEDYERVLEVINNI
jgi:hypothetical protein